MPPKNLVKRDSNEMLLEKEFLKLEKLKYSKDEATAKKVKAQIEKILVFREQHENKPRAAYDERLAEAVLLVMAETKLDPAARRRVVRREIVSDASGDEAPSIL